MKEICLCINDDGSMSVKVEDKEMTEQEAPGTPVKSLEEALQAIKAFAESTVPPEEGTQEGMDMMQQEQGMGQTFQTRR